MANVIIPQTMDTLIFEMKNILEYSVIKDAYQAKLNSNKERMSEYYGNQYVTCYNDTYSFDTFYDFDQDLLIHAGYSLDEILKWKSKNDMPKDYRRQIVVDLQADRVKKTYIERNNYYRLLNGQPDFEDNQPIFADPSFYIEAGMLDQVPVHELTIDQYIILENGGYLESLKEEYPDKSYLWHMGYDSVDYYTARMTPDFACLNLNKTKVQSFIYDEFLSLYESSREWHMTVVYNKDMANGIEYYRNYIGMSIMFYAIELLITKSFEYNISRDFLDLPTIKLFYDAYKIPFIRSFTLEQHKDFAKNINYLMQYKSTEECMYEIFRIFGFQDLVLYRYYLIKQRKFNENGDPVFIYKDENGKKVLDEEAVNTFYFQLVDARTTNLAQAFNDNTLRKEYDMVISNDIYWVEDAALKHKLLNSKFNYIESKYLGLSLMYKFAEKMFDMQYAHSLVFDNREQVETISIMIQKLYGLTPVNLFEAMVLLQGLYCKKLGFSGQVQYPANQVAKILGFNFINNSDEIRDLLLNNELCNPRLKELLNTIPFTTANNIDKFYKELKEFSKLIDEGFTKAKTKEEAQLYRAIHKIMMVRDMQRDCFIKQDGTPAEFIEEFLSDYNSNLYATLVGTDIGDIDHVMSTIIDSIVEYIPSFSDLYMESDSGTKLIDSVLQLLVYFKSYTVDIIKGDSNVFFDSRSKNSIKLCDELTSLSVDYTVPKNLYLYDIISKIENEFVMSDSFKLRDCITDIMGLIEFSDEVKFEDRLSIYNEMYLKTLVRLREEIELKNEMDMSSYIKIRDDLYLIMLEILRRDNINLSHDILIDNSMELASYKKTGIDFIDKMNCVIESNLSVVLKEICKYDITHTGSEFIGLRDYVYVDRY